MTKYKENLRLKSLGLSQQKIAEGCQVSKKTVNKVLNAAEERNVSWPLEAEITAGEIEKLLFPDTKKPQQFCLRQNHKLQRSTLYGCRRGWRYRLRKKRRRKWILFHF